MATAPEKLKIHFVGVGGQGSLTICRLLGQAAVVAGCDVIVSEIHGMSQRGGVVESSVLLGGLVGPILDDGDADLLVAFEPLEAIRALPKASNQTHFIINTKRILPSTVSRGQAEYPPVEELFEQIRPKVAGMTVFDATALALKVGSALATNMVMLGAVCKTGLLPFDADTVKKVIIEKTPEKFRDVNLEAFELGFAV